MKHMRRLICMALMIATVLSLSVSAFAAEYTFESTSDSEYYPSTSYQHEDADFMVGENVMLIVQHYEDEKLQMYGKIMSKW